MQLPQEPGVQFLEKGWFPSASFGLDMCSGRWFPCTLLQGGPSPGVTKSTCDQGGLQHKHSPTRGLHRPPTRPASRFVRSRRLMSHETSRTCSISQTSGLQTSDFPSCLTIFEWTGAKPRARSAKAQTPEVNLRHSVTTTSVTATVTSTTKSRTQTTTTVSTSSLAEGRRVAGRGGRTLLAEGGGSASGLFSEKL